jgi:hypothetical protein
MRGRLAVIFRLTGTAEAQRNDPGEDRMDGELRPPPYRRRLPHRRAAITETIVIGNTTIAASIGFDETGQPAEVFLSGAKDRSGMAAILDDASVVISIALQHGIPAAALAKSISRAPDGMGHISASSAIGAALDLLVEYETGQHGLLNRRR